MKHRLTKLALGIGAALYPLSALADPFSVIAFATAAYTAATTASAIVLLQASAFMVATAYGMYSTVKAKRTAKKEAAYERARFNAMLEDRSANVLSAIPPWRIVYGRAEVGCSIHAIFTKDKVGYKADGSQYTRKDALHYMVCVFAAHKCSAWHDLKINNETAGPFDANGWSLNAKYQLKEPTRIFREVQIASGASVVENVPIIASTLTAYPDNWSNTIDAPPASAVPVTLSGDRLTVTNIQGYTVRASYVLEQSAVSALRVWFHDGDPDQVADANLMSLFPDKWTSAHRLRGRCYFVIMVDLELPEFQSGPPQFTADLSGRLVYDPRTLGTAFSPNNALCVRDFLTSKWGAEATTDELDDVLTAASANACDTTISLKEDGYTDSYAAAFFPGSGAQGWVAQSATFANFDGEYRTLTATGQKPLLSISTSWGPVSGSTSRYVRVRIRRTGGSGWAGKCYYKTALHDFSENYRKDIPAGAAVGGGWVELVFDMHSLTIGAGDWKSSDITGLRFQFGLGTGDNFDIDWIATSAYAEQTVSGPKYTLNGSFTTDQGREEILGEMAASMFGFVTNSGQWKIVAGSWTAPVMSIGDDDLDGQIGLVQADTGLEDLSNSARGVYFKQGSSTPTEFKPYQNDTLVTEDGEQLWEEVSFPFTNNETRSRNLARSTVERTRSGQILTVPLQLHAWPLTVGDRISLTSSEYQISSKSYRVLDWNFGVSSPVTLTVQEDTAGIYDQADTTLSDPTPNTDMPSPTLVQDVYGLNANSGNDNLLRDQDGTVRARVLVSWDPAIDGYLVSGSAVMEIAWRRLFIDAADAWRVQTVPATDTNAYLDNVRENEIIVIRARYRNSAGVWGDAAFLYHTVVGKSEPPSNVAGLNAVMVEGGVRFTWDACPETDYLETEIRHGVSWAAGTQIFVGAATSAFWPRPTLGTYTIWAKHRDTSRIESDTASSGIIEVLAGEGGGGAITWTSITGRPAMWRLVSTGYGAVGYPSVGTGYFNGETNVLVGSVGRSYNVLKVLRSTGATVWLRDYDVYGVGAAGSLRTAADMAADLNACTAEHIVMIVAHDEPQANRFTSGLDTAMYRCGASRAVFGSSQFKANSAYILVGIPGCGEGQGYEAYQGAVDQDPNAWCDVTLQVLSGNFIVSGSGATPKSLRDYAYTGDYDATKDIKLVGSSIVTINGNTATKTGGVAGWGGHVYSLDAYGNGAYAAARLTHNGADHPVMLGLTTDPTANESYDTIDYAIYPTPSGIYRYQNGSGVLLSAAVAVAGDLLAVTYDGDKVYYLLNGVVQGDPVVVGAGKVLHLDTAFYSIGVGLSEIRFGPLSPVNEISHAQLSTAVQTDLSNALSTAAAAQATADGKIDSYWQASAPGTASEGDLWFDTDDNLKQYRWTSGAWVLAADVRIGTAISNAATAQATADGKVVSFFQTTQPTAVSIGDLWFDTDNGHALYRWNGASWVPGLIGTGGIADESATSVITSLNAGPVSLPASIELPDNQTNVITVTVGPYAFNTRVRASATFKHRITSPISKVGFARMRICNLNTQTFSSPPMQDFAHTPANITQDSSSSLNWETSLASGTTARIALGGYNGNVVAPSGTVDARDASMTIEVIKK